MKRARQPIPTRLREAPRWVRWEFVNGKKTPKQLSGRNASSTQPATWSDYTSVTDAAREDGRRGFVLNGDGIVCIDLDHCLKENGNIRLAALELWMMAPVDTYIEVSPSGDGLHIWGTGRVRRGRRTSFHGQSVELYGTGRYMAVTGQRWADSPSRLANIQPLIDFIDSL